MIPAIVLMLMVMFLTVCPADGLMVLDTYDLLTPDEVEDGALLDPDSLFAYVLLDDDTIKLTRYTWVNPHVTIPADINGVPVSWIGGYAFMDTPVKEIVLPWGRNIDSEAFSYSDLRIILVCDGRFDQ